MLNLGIHVASGAAVNRRRGAAPGKSVWMVQLVRALLSKGQLSLWKASPTPIAPGLLNLGGYRKLPQESAPNRRRRRLPRRNSSSFLSRTILWDRSTSRRFFLLVATELAVLRRRGRRLWFPPRV